MPVTDNVLALDREVLHGHLVAIDDADELKIRSLDSFENQNRDDYSHHVKDSYEDPDFFLVEGELCEWEVQVVLATAYDHQELVRSDLVCLSRREGLTVVKVNPLPAGIGKQFVEVSRGHIIGSKLALVFLVAVSLEVALDFCLRGVVLKQGVSF